MEGKIFIELKTLIQLAIIAILFLVMLIAWVAEFIKRFRRKRK